MQQRLSKILRILIPRVTLADRGIQLIIAQFALLLVSVTLQTGFIQKISSSLQGLAMQGDIRGYIMTNLYSMGLVVVTTAFDVGLQWINPQIAKHWTKRLNAFVMEQYTGGGRFYSVAHVDKRIGDADTRITLELIEVCDQLAKMMKGDRGGGMMMSGITQSRSNRGSGYGQGGIVRPVYEAIMCTAMLIRSRKSPLCTRLDVLVRAEECRVQGCRCRRWLRCGSTARRAC